MSSTPGKSRFLIHAPEGAKLTDFLALAEIDPDIAVVDILGPRTQPHTAVIEVDAEKAQALEQQFSRIGSPHRQFRIEPDQPMSMFDRDPAGPN